MRAVRIHEVGGPEVLQLDTVADPAPGPAEAVVRMEAIGVNFIEIYQRNGLYKHARPFTLGAEGAFYRHRDGTSFRIPAFEVVVKCTCGCGDAFNAGFAAGIVNGMGPKEAVRLAQACSALNATGLGSQAGVVDWDRTIEFMRRTPERVPAQPAAMTS